MTAQLQRANVRGDRPTILDLDLRRVVGHRAETVGHDVEEMADRRRAQAIVEKRRRMPIASPDNHAVAKAGAAVAWRTVDVEALLAPRHQRRVTANGNTVASAPFTLPVYNKRVFVQLTARDGARHGRPGRSVVGEKRGWTQRNVLGLIVHVLAAAGALTTSAADDCAAREQARPTEDTEEKTRTSDLR